MQHNNIFLSPSVGLKANARNEFEYFLFFFKAQRCLTEILLISAPAQRIAIFCRFVVFFFQFCFGNPTVRSASP